jgi:hypothetical protein
VNSLDFGAIFLSLGVVLGAIFSGILTGHHWRKPSLHIAFNRVGTASGLLLIVYSLFLSSGGGGAKNTLWNQQWSFYVGVMMPCILGLLSTTLASRSFGLTHPETVAASIGCCYRNTGIATSVAVTMFTNVERRAQAVAVPLFYGVVEAIAIIIYGVVSWKLGWTKAPVNENMFVVLTKTYEADDDEHDSDASSNDDRDVEHGVDNIDQHDSQVDLEKREDEESMSHSSFHSVMEEGVLQRRNTRPTGLFAWVARLFHRRSLDADRSRDFEERSGSYKGKQADKHEHTGNRPRLASDMTQQTASSTESLSSPTPSAICSPIIIRQRSSPGPLDDMIFESVAEGSFEEGSHEAGDSSSEEEE